MKFESTKFINYILVILVAYLQIILPKNFGLNEQLPNFIFLIAITYIILNNISYSLIWLIFGGVLLDFISFGRFGWITLSFIIASSPIYYLFSTLIRDPSFLISAILFFFSSLLGEAMLYLFYKINLSWDILIYSFVNMVAGVIIFQIMKNNQAKHQSIKLQ